MQTLSTNAPGAYVWTGHGVGKVRAGTTRKSVELKGSQRYVAQSEWCPKAYHLHPTSNGIE